MGRKYEDIDPSLREFCRTPRQERIFDLLVEHGTCTKVAEIEGVHLSGIARTITQILERAAKQGRAPGHFNDGVAPGYTMGKVTIQRGPGGVERVWERQSPEDDTRRQELEAAYAALADDLPRLSPLRVPRHTLAELCNVYTLTDCHIGMLAWRKEGGEDWDLKIAERTLTGAFQAMVSASPDAKTCIIAQLGDFLHYDGLVPVTPTSGHILDADGRFGKMVEVAIRVLRAVIDEALAKHERVILVPAEGNHDMASSVWLRKMFKALYELEPRLEVIDSELPYYAYQHGETAIFWHHSHLKRLDQLPLMMAAQFPEIWGSTRRRFAHTGDKHHTEEKEHSGIVVMQHPTLAARDAYASRHGWHALRRATSITYHTRYGEVARNTVCPEMLEAPCAA